MRRIVPALVTAGLVLWPSRTAADCGRDDAVTLAAADALRTGDTSRILTWVAPSDEQVLRAAFQKARTVRALGDDARELADDSFVHTAIRLSRQGCDVENTRTEPIAATTIDRALVTGDDSELVTLVLDRVRSSLHARFLDVTARSASRRGDIDAGRAYVARYTAFVQYVTDLYTLASRRAPRVIEPPRHEP